MKKIIVVFAALLTSFTGLAQFKQLAASEEFKEAENGISKIIQFKNGGTLFYVIDPKKGIDVKVFDAAHKQKAETHINPAYEKLHGSVDAAFEINGDAVIFVTDAEGKIPTLIRLIIDGATGNLKEEKKIAALQKVKTKMDYAIMFGGIPMPDFFVRKDPYSENYAVILFNSFESDRSKRIEIVHFSANHQEINRAYFASPGEQYKYLQYIDMTVIGSEKVAVMVYAYNTANSGGKESQLLLATLDAGAKSVSMVDLKFTKDLIIDGGICRYNPVSKQVILLAAARESRKSSAYTVFLTFIDPYSKVLLNSFDIYPSAANEKSLELFGHKNKYTGMPQNLYINNDGSFSVVYEEITMFTNYEPTYYTTNTDLGHVAVSRFNKDGKETSSHFIPKSHHISTTIYNSQPIDAAYSNFYLYNNFYISEREGKGFFLKSGNQYKSFNYLNGKDQVYILFNDVEKNAEQVLKGRVTPITGVSACDAFYFDIDGKVVMPERKFLFGKPEDKRENNLALFGISDYDREKNIYVTLELSKKSGKKSVQIVWLQPQ